MIIIIMGVCGSGKSTVAQILSQKLGIDFIEGDTFHSEENVKKMERLQQEMHQVLTMELQL